MDGANWDALGQPELWTLWRQRLDLQVKWEYYSDDRRLQRLRGGTSVTPGRDLELQYVYDNVGNVTQISDKRGAVAQFQTFTYDALDRLTQGATSGAGTWGTYSEGYAYNAIGNLTSKGGVTYNYHGAAHQARRDGTSAGGSFELRRQRQHDQPAAAGGGHDLQPGVGRREPAGIGDGGWADDELYLRRRWGVGQEGSRRADHGVRGQLL